MQDCLKTPLPKICQANILEKVNIPSCFQEVTDLFRILLTGNGLVIKEGKKKTATIECASGNER